MKCWYLQNEKQGIYVKIDALLAGGFECTN